MNFLNFLNRDARGQGLVEYGLLIILIAIVVMVVLIALGIDISNVFMDIETSMP